MYLYIKNTGEAWVSQTIPHEGDYVEIEHQRLRIFYYSRDTNGRSRVDELTGTSPGSSGDFSKQVAQGIPLKNSQGLTRTYGPQELETLI